MTGTVATPATDPEATPTPVMGPTATPAPAAGTAAGPENQPVLLSVTPTCKTERWMQKLAHLVGEKSPVKKGKEEEEEEAGYSK